MLGQKDTPRPPPRRSVDVFSRHTGQTWVLECPLYGFHSLDARFMGVHLLLGDNSSNLSLGKIDRLFSYVANYERLRER